MDTQKYRRKPLEVDAVQVTEENFYDVAKWCEGNITSTRQGVDGSLIASRKYIEISVVHPLNARQRRAFVGDWVLKSDQGFKIYSGAAFAKGFELVPPLNPALSPEDAQKLKSSLTSG
jgi:hypothetical protein